ncbi:hypothetical protein IG631_12897 [Alternaria alternata]|nr:hypothetical protein IG631_12897 [Alternaria alternata]
MGRATHCWHCSGAIGSLRARLCPDFSSQTCAAATAKSTWSLRPTRDKPSDFCLLPWLDTLNVSCRLIYSEDEVLGTVECGKERLEMTCTK